MVAFELIKYWNTAWASPLKKSLLFFQMERVRAVGAAKSKSTNKINEINLIFDCGLLAANKLAEWTNKEMKWIYLWMKQAAGWPARALRKLSFLLHQQQSPINFIQIKDIWFDLLMKWIALLIEERKEICCAIGCVHWLILIEWNGEMNASPIPSNKSTQFPSQINHFQFNSQFISWRWMK